MFYSCFLCRFYNTQANPRRVPFSGYEEGGDPLGALVYYYCLVGKLVRRVCLCHNYIMLCIKSTFTVIFPLLRKLRKKVCFIKPSKVVRDWLQITSTEEGGGFKLSMHVQINVDADNIFNIIAGLAECVRLSRWEGVIITPNFVLVVCIHFLHIGTP